MIWDKYIALKILPFLILGIALSEFVYVDIHTRAIIAIPVVAVMWVALIFGKRVFKIAFGVLLLPTVIYLGFSRQSERNLWFDQLEKVQNANRSIVRIDGQPEKKERSTAYSVTILSVETDSGWYEAQTKAFLYLGMDSLQNPYSYGDILLVNGLWNEIQPALNPHSFDYQKFASRKGVKVSQFQYAEHVTKLDSGYCNPWMARIYRLRSEFEETLKNQGFSGDEYGVARAVIMGDKGAVTGQMLEKYSSSGAMHVLAVSGLHVGIIYFIFALILKPITRLRNGLYIRLASLVLILWFYALFTGMSASVVRASTMFTAVAFAQSVKRITHIYNTVALSALILLIVKPNLLFEVGFQLSYTAVLGIVSFQPLFESWYKPKSKIVKWIYGLAGVSIAAQLATFPIALGIFNQFPNLFLLSNFIVIPMITIILYYGVLLMLLHSVIAMPNFLFEIWRWMIQVMNSGVSFIESIPFSVADGLWISKLEIFAVYVLIIGVFIIMKYDKYRNYIPILISLGLLVSVKITRRNPPNEMVFYSLPKSEGIDFAWDGKRYFVYTDTLYQSEDYNFHVRGNHLATGDSVVPFALELNKYQSESIPFYQRDNVIQFADITIAWLRPGKPNWTADYTFIDDKSGFLQLDSTDWNTLGVIVLASRLSNSKRTWLKRELSARALPIIDLSAGYFRKRID